ncbi:MAG: polysaccharide biosynthesis tyrosine autokinase [Anaerolineae bacterium]
MINTDADVYPDLQAYWQLIRRWLWLIILAALLAGGTAYTVSRWFVEPIYSAQAQIVIQPSSSVTGSEYSDILAGQRAALTYAEMIQSLPLQETALSKMGYTVEPQSTHLDFPLLTDLTVQPVRDTQIVEVKVESPDPQFAADFTNALIEVFIEQNQERQSARYQDAQMRLQAQMDDIEENIGELKARLTSIEEAEERGRIEAQIIQLQDSLSRLSSAYQSIQVAELQAADLVSVVEPARVPRNPVRPRTMMNTLLAAVVGGMVAVGGVFLREYLDMTVRNPDEVEALSQAPVLGKIWYEEKIAESNGKAGIVVHHPLSLTAEAYRLLRTNLQFSSVDTPLKVILVTSPGPTEGKSTIVYNLGLALAASGKHVILVDADMRRPKLCEYAGVERKPGLSDVLVKQNLNLKEYLKPAQDMDDLWVLPPGQMSPNPTELLGSRRMSELLNNFRERNDVIVLLDSPPVLAAADAPVLAALADGVLLVLEVGQTNRQMLAQAVEQIRRSGTRLLGSVLNKVPMNGKGSYYYYYYAEEEDHRSIWPWQKRKRRRRRSTTEEKEA